VWRQLGNGLNAHFQLESGFKSNTGELDNTKNVLFNRTSRSGWAGLGLYRSRPPVHDRLPTEKFLDPFDHHYTPHRAAVLGRRHDPAGGWRPTAGLSASSSSGTRFNNDIQYTGTFGRLTLRAEYALGEIAAIRGKGAAKAVGFSYAGGPLLAAGAYTVKRTATGFVNRAFVAGGGVKFLGMTVKAGMSRERQETAPRRDYQNAIRFGGISLPLPLAPAVALTAAVYRSVYDSAAGGGRRDLMLAGLTYSFSKRSNIYAEFDLNRYDGLLVPASQQRRQRGMSLGLMHAF
jgi:predicted porin